MDRSFPGRTENRAENEGKIRCPDGTFLFFFSFSFFSFLFSSLFLFVHRQRTPPAVLEAVYACSTFMDNCTPISLKAKPPTIPRPLPVYTMSWKSWKIGEISRFQSCGIFHDTNFLMGITGIPSGMYKCYSISLNTFYAIFLSYFTNNVFSDHVSGDRIKES